MGNSIPIVAAVVVVVLIGVMVGAGLLRDLAATRTDLTREQRAREDKARLYAQGIEQRNFEADIVASIFDPLGLFH